MSMAMTVGLTRAEAEDLVRDIVEEKLSEVGDSDLLLALEALLGMDSHPHNYCIVSRSEEGEE